MSQKIWNPTVLIICVLFWLMPLSALSAVDDEALKTAVQQTIELKPAKLLGLEGHGMDAPTIDQALFKAYRDNDFQTFWVKTDGPGDRAGIIKTALFSSNKEGLDPPDYFFDKIEKYWESTDATGIARLDVLLTLGIGRYVADLREGRAEPKELDPKLFATARDADIDPVELVREARRTPDLKRYLDEQAPPFVAYQNLRDALAEYRVFEANGGWETIPEGKTLKAGMNDPRVSVVRKRLAISGDLQSEDLESTLYDDVVAVGVKHFQKRHGLAEDGALGKQTLAQMNVPVDKRIRQIRVNMERWRWIDRDQTNSVIAVNIAGFELVGVENQQFNIIMPVIVGKTFHMTPVFSDQISYVEINPYWNVPPSIAKKEMLPKLKKDARYLEKRNFRLFESWQENAKELDSTSIPWASVSARDMARYHIRQDPGPKNALGTVKFMFPNQFNVYLHDTPSHSLFGRTKRTFSHGCIRVSRPAELASYVLGGEEGGWGVDKVNDVIASGERKVVRLDKPLPVYILYRTVLVYPDTDQLMFLQDVYGRDALLEKALFSS